MTKQDDQKNRDKTKTKKHIKNNDNTQKASRQKTISATEKTNTKTSHYNKTIKTKI